MRLRRFLLSAFALTMLAGPALAAEITQISYDVTGGTLNFLGRGSTPIIGGSLVYTPPGGSVSTPASFTLGGSIWLRLEGQDFSGGPGYYTIRSPLFSARINPEVLPSAGVVTAVIKPNLFGVTAAGHFAAVISLPGPTSQFLRSCWDATYGQTCRTGPRARVYATYYGDRARGYIQLSGTPNRPVDLFVHRFTIGNEVRTLPEPTMDVNLSLGLITLTVYALFRRRRRQPQGH